MSGILRCTGHNGYNCVRGTLFEENIMTGDRANKGPCPVCTGVVPPEAKKVVQMPGVQDRSAGDVAGVRNVHTNAMGHMKVPINAKHERHIQRIRDVALELYVELHDAGGTDPNQDRFANRNLAIAATDLEGVVMRAIRGVCDRK